MDDLTLEHRLQQCGISTLNQEDPEFVACLDSFSGTHRHNTPRLITLPTDAEQVATIVSECISRGTTLVVRGGGHDMFGRFTHGDAVSIDLRKLDSIQVATNKKSANIGGGATASQVANALNAEGLQVPVGSCGAVGFAGWSLIGGFGPYIQSYGLGADQITGAKVVNAQGNIVQADEQLLKGLRGGGGCLGIVVELTVKVYPTQGIQAGTVLFDSTDLENAVTGFFSGYEALLDSYAGKFPRQLSVLPSVLSIPGLGVTLSCSIVWNGPSDDESRLWIDRIASLAPRLTLPGPPQALVSTTNPAAYMDLNTSMLPKEISGRVETASIRRFSPAVIATLARQATKIPATSVGGLIMHILRADSPSISHEVPLSVCPYREPQIVIEILGVALDAEKATPAVAWALDARRDLGGLDDLLKQTYLPMTPPEVVDLQAIYQDKLAELKSLKRLHDPLGVFAHAIPNVVG